MLLSHIIPLIGRSSLGIGDVVSIDIVVHLLRLAVTRLVRATIVEGTRLNEVLEKTRFGGLETSVAIASVLLC